MLEAKNAGDKMRVTVEINFIVKKVIGRIDKLIPGVSVIEIKKDKFSIERIKG